VCVEEEEEEQEEQEEEEKEEEGSLAATVKFSGEKGGGKGNKNRKVHESYKPLFSSRKALFTSTRDFPCNLLQRRGWLYVRYHDMVK
jgi:hypothetical protein